MNLFHYLIVTPIALKVKSFDKTLQVVKQEKQSDDFKEVKLLKRNLALHFRSWKLRLYTHFSSKEMGKYIIERKMFHMEMKLKCWRMHFFKQNYILRVPQKYIELIYA